MILVVDLDAADRHALDGAHVGDAELASDRSTHPDMLPHAQRSHDVRADLELSRRHDAPCRWPLMFRVGHNHRSVRELNLEAGPADHHLGRRDNPRGLSVCADQEVPNRDITHGGPAGRRRQRRIQLERLPHTRPGRDHDHLPGMQPVGHLVEFGESRWHTAGDPALGRDGVDLVHRRLQQFLQRHEVLGGLALGDVVDLGLCAVDDLVDVGALGPGVAVLHHPRAGLHQPPQQGLLGDDARVVAGVRRGRHRRDQGVQIRRPADAAQQPTAVQFRGHCDGVGGFTAAVKVEDRVVDVLVGRAVEVAGPQPLEDVGDRILAQ